MKTAILTLLVTTAFPSAFAAEQKPVDYSKVPNYEDVAFFQSRDTLMDTLSSKVKGQQNIDCEIGGDPNQSPTSTTRDYSCTLSPSKAVFTGTFTSSFEADDVKAPAECAEFKRRQSTAIFLVQHLCPLDGKAIVVTTTFTIN